MKKGINGFTLIEILVSLGILVIIMVVASNMFFTILKSSSKAKILTEVKQNGNYALNVMARMIRNAKRLESYSLGGEWIEILNPDDETITFSCGDSDGDGITDIALNGASLISDKVEVESCIALFGVTEGEEGVKPATVAISFILSEKGTPSRPEERASVDFRTTVTFRNY